MTANPGNINDNGDIVVNVGLDKFTFDSTITADAAGKVAVKISTMSGDLSKLDYKLDSHSWVIKMADAAAHDQIVAQITNAVNQALNGMGGQIQQDLDLFLSKFNYEIQVGKTDIFVDSHVIYMTTDGDLDLSLNGTAYKSGSKQCPYEPVELPAWTSKADGKLQFSSYLLNTIAFAGSDEVDFLIDQSVIPSQVKVSLTTDFFDAYFPGLKATFGSAPVSFEVTIPDVPEFHIKDSLFKGNLNAAFTMRIVDAANGNVKAFDCTNAIYNENNIEFMRNSTGLYAHVTVPTLTMNNLVFQNVHAGLNLDSATAATAINELFKEAMAQFNQEGSYIGIALPDWVALESLDVFFKEEVLELAVTTGLNAAKFRDLFF